VKAVIDRQWAQHEALKKEDKICPLVFHRKGKAIRSYRKAWNAACDVVTELTRCIVATR
jgi:hypothetical protein